MAIFEFSKQCYHQGNAQHYSKRRHPIKTMAPASILLNTDKRKADLAINWLAILAVNAIYEGGKVCTKAGKEELALKKYLEFAQDLNAKIGQFANHTEVM